MRDDAAGADAVARLLTPPRRVLIELAGRPPGLRDAGIDPPWLADQLRDLAPRFAEPILLRRRSTAGQPWEPAREAYAADALARDLAAATADIWSRTHDAYRTLADGWIRARRLRFRGRRIIRLADAEWRALRRRIARPADPLLTAIDQLVRASTEEQWFRERARLEERWADAWHAMATELYFVWDGELGPRLARLARLRTGTPGWLIAAGLALAGSLIALGFLVW